jgi:hypothetical protein
MCAGRLLLSPLLALLVSCGSDSNRKSTLNKDRAFTGVTEYYRPGFHPQPVNSPATAMRPRYTGTMDRSPRFNASHSGRRPGFSAAPNRSFGNAPPVFSNPDGTISRVVGSRLLRSDGTSGDLFGNTAYHPNGTKSRIVGDTLHNPDGTTSPRIHIAP